MVTPVPSLTPVKRASVCPATPGLSRGASSTMGLEYGGSFQIRKVLFPGESLMSLSVVPLRVHIPILIIVCADPICASVITP
jgi:hypothetical protein